YPDQPTVRDLEEVYHYRAIDRSTRLIGVTGFGERERATVAALNAALAHLGLNARGWPLALGSVRLFRKIIEAVKLAGVVVDQEHRRDIVGITAEQDPAVREAGAAD